MNKEALYVSTYVLWSKTALGSNQSTRDSHKGWSSVYLEHKVSEVICGKPY